MADTKILYLLLAEDNSSDAEFLKEALAEIDENVSWVSWHSSQTSAVTNLRDALECLGGHRCDAMLLNLSLPDSSSLLNTFLETRAAAPDTPIIVLLDRADEHLANWLLREGAQDVLSKPAVECEPLARAIRYAIERQRRVDSISALEFVDQATGFYDRRGFLALGEQYLRLAKRTGSALSVIAVETDRCGDPGLTLIEAAERLRCTLGENALLGRMSERGFAALVPGSTRPQLTSARVAVVAADAADETGIGDLLEQAQRQLNAKAAMLAD